MTPRSAKALHTLYLVQFENSSLNIIALFKDKLLVYGLCTTKLFIYKQDGHYISNIAIMGFETGFNVFVSDATWTPFGNIVFTIRGNSVVVISDMGSVIKMTQMKDPTSLSVSNDNIIYVVDSETDVHQSLNDGISWSVIFSSVNGWHILSVAKVITQNSEDFWTLEANNISSHHLLRVFNVKNKERVNDAITWTTTDLNKNIVWSANKLMYDGNGNIFFGDFSLQSVFVMSVYGHYRGRPRQLLSFKFTTYYLISLCMDNMRRLLYVGNYGGIIMVFNLTYTEVP